MTSAQLNTPIPKWITLVCSGISLLGLFVGASLYISPGTFIPGIDFAANGARFLAWMWAARQVAIAGIIGYSVVRQSAPMLKVSLIAYVLMTGQDIFIGIAKGDSGIIIGTSIGCLLAASMIFVLTKRGTEKEQ